MKDNRLVSIIIVTWNSEKFVIDAVDSVLKQTYKPVEIIVIDNASTDGTIDLLKNRYSSSQINLVLNDSNIGFSAANNMGLALSRGAFVLFLNPDTILKPDYLLNAVEGFRDDDIGAVSGRILRFDRKTIDSTGQFLAKNRRPVEWGYDNETDEVNTRSGDCFSVCGAAAFYRREAILEMMIEDEFFDEDFFAFYEDLDAGWRLNLLGWRCYFNNDAVMYHHRGGTRADKKGFIGRVQISGRPLKIQADIIRNRWFTIVKNDHFINYLLHLPWIIAQDLKTLFYILIFNRKLFLPVYTGFIKYLPRMLQKRKMIKSRRKLKAYQIRRRM